MGRTVYICTIPSCHCPAATSTPTRRSQRRYIPGRITNRAGSRTEPVDEIAIDRAVSGDTSIRLIPAERAAAVARLDRRGWSAARIAEHLGCTQRTVTRWRARHRATAGSVR
jgi:DNA-binding NarL/FixJ family response regulator